NERKEFHITSAKAISGRARASQRRSTGGPLNGGLPSSTMGPSTSSMPAMPSVTCDPWTSQPRDHSTTTGAGAGGGAGVDAGAEGSGVGNTGAEGRTGSATGFGQACPISRSPSPVPGTPGADAEVTKHHHLIGGIHPTGEEPSHHDFIESLDPTDLAIEFRRFVGSDPSTLSSQDIKVQLQRYATHHSVPVVPPKRQVEVNQLSQNSFGIGYNNPALVN
ncbi:hypothetical protein FRC06_010603, partial [Ceratobasidium sp. 370]